MIGVAMSGFEKEWTVESALEILHHPTVDSRIWAEAVEWLLVYGPPEIQEMLSQASSFAANKEFPDLKPQGFTDKGELVYSIAELARALEISEEEAAEMIAEKQRKHGVRQIYDSRDSRKIQ